MGRVRQLVIALAILVLITVAASFLVASALYVVAAVAPLIGLAFALASLRRGVELWRSHGRFQLPDGMRIIAAGRARVVGAMEMAQGLGALILSLVPAAIAWGSLGVTIPLLGTGLAVQIAAGVVRRQVMAGAHAVDVLPPQQ